MVMHYETPFSKSRLFLSPLNGFVSEAHLQRQSRGVNDTLVRRGVPLANHSLDVTMLAALQRSREPSYRGR
jgi:hypothetical protein